MQKIALQAEFQQDRPDRTADMEVSARTPPDQANLIDRLVTSGFLDEAGLTRARALAGESSAPLHILLTRLGLVSDQDMAAALSDELNIPIATDADFPLAPVLQDRLGERFLRDAMVLPLAETETKLVLAMVDPFDRFAYDAVSVAAGKPIEPRIALGADLEAAFNRLYDSESSQDDSGSHSADGFEEDIASLRDRASEAPVIRFANGLIDRAVSERASDIHIEPGPYGLSIRFRVDGRLRSVEPPPRGMDLALLSRLKLMAKLDIAERRLPQDGRIRLVSAGREIDLRVATVPGNHGESIVLRLLDRSAVRLDLQSLGYDETALASIKSLLNRRSGIILVTGPTGAGKTTTLYSALKDLATPDVKVMSVEDPVEYRIEGMTQIQVKPQIGLTFATALRSILRHDPDIVMVGEIRDRETAEIAIQAALTGHLVLSTVHTNSAVATINRLLDMGVADYLLAPTIVGVIAQRLVRRLCPECRRPAEKDWSREIVFPATAKEAEQFEASGCAKCHGTGFRGRLAVTEILTMTDEMRRRIVGKASSMELLEAALEGGMRSLRSDGLAKAAAGLTTVEEILQLGLEDERT